MKKIGARLFVMLTMAAAVTAVGASVTGHTHYTKTASAVVSSHEMAPADTGWGTPAQ
jgi:hypothetical protein